MLDSGATVVLMNHSLAVQAGVQYSPEHSLALQIADATTSRTLGKVTSNVDIALCYGTPGQVILRMPIHVIKTPKQQRWGLLLGTGFLNTIGACLDFFGSRLSYRPHLLDAPEADPDSEEQQPTLQVYTIPILTTTNNPSPEFFADLLAPSGHAATLPVPTSSK